MKEGEHLLGSPVGRWCPLVSERRFGAWLIRKILPEASETIRLTRGRVVFGFAGTQGVSPATLDG